MKLRMFYPDKYKRLLFFRSFFFARGTVPAARFLVSS
jgi:hypothetical protein